MGAAAAGEGGAFDWGPGVLDERLRVLDRRMAPPAAYRRPDAASAAGARPHPPLIAELPPLARIAGRELVWGLRRCAQETARCRALANSIPDASLRADALVGLTRKRPHLDGAAMFAMLPSRRSNELLSALVAFQTILEYLDGVNERAATAGVANGLALHRALADALAPPRLSDVPHLACSSGAPRLPRRSDAPSRPLDVRADYYRRNPSRDDGGYLRALVQRCQSACVALPGYEAIRPQLLAQAARCRVLALNHEPEPERRERRLRQWAASEQLRAEATAHAAQPRRRRAEGAHPWYELAGAATGSLGVHALLALAADAPVEEGRIEALLCVYQRISLLATMLDSYVDRPLDAREGTHSYVAHYGSSEIVVSRLSALIGECIQAARTLPDGRRHAVLVASMVAMYLSCDSARSPSMSRDSRALARAGGPLTTRLLPALRAWRVAHDLTSA